MIGLKRGTVKLWPHNKKWKSLFGRERKILEKKLGDLVVDIQHIGSTAIQDVMAKPIIDMAIAVDNIENIDKCKKLLKEIGCGYRGDAGRDGGHLFVKCSEPGIRTHHLHFVHINDKQWKSYINFRDHLNTNRKLAHEYSILKKELKKRYSANRKAYTNSKSEFIRAGLKNGSFATGTK